MSKWNVSINVFPTSSATFRYSVRMWRNHELGTFQRPEKHFTGTAAFISHSVARDALRSMLSGMLRDL